MNSHDSQGVRFQSIWIKGWLAFSAWAGVSGWLLSFCHELNLGGYIVMAAIGLTLALACKFPFRAARMEWHRGMTRQWRWRRLLPFLYLLLLGLSLIGGLLYAPNNYDFLTYRFSRVLHWWSEGGWHWIDTINPRMNYSGTGFEWTMTPFLILTHSDRFFFLINLFSYALLPGLFFQVAGLLGVRRRVAWYWMWILPGAYCFAMQAGSASNDAYAAIYALASVVFFLKAWKTGKVTDFAWGMVAAALMTGAKASNLPLLLPCLLAALPALSKAARSWVKMVPVVLVAILISFVPLALLNTHYTGHWSGDPKNEGGMRLKNPAAGLLGNGLQLLNQSVAPPVLPGGKKVTEIAEKLLPASLKSFLNINFPRFTLFFGELPQEEGAGLGLGVTSLLIVSLTAGFSQRKKQQRNPIGIIIGLSSWVALFSYMALMGSESTARLLSSYYPLLILPLLLLGGQETLTRKTWWKCWAGLAVGSALIALILTPSRPLFPSAQTFAWASRIFKGNAQIERARMVYQVYQDRSDNLAVLRSEFPSDVKVIGAVLGGNETEVSLWKPFGSRKVVSLWNKKKAVNPGDISIIVASQQGLEDRKIPAVQILGFPVKSIRQTVFTVGRGPEDVYLLIK